MSSGGNMDFHAGLNDASAASYFDGAREGVMVFMAVLIAGTALIGQFGTFGLNWTVAVLLVVALAVLGMVVTARFFSKRNQRKKEREAEEFRSMQRRERQRLVDEMNAAEKPTNSAGD